MPIGARTVGAGGYGKITLPEPYNKDAHSTVAEPCTTRKPGPAKALKLGIKLPWEGKVEQQDRELLTKELFMDLEAYGLTRDEIRRLFIHLSVGDFYDRIKAMGIPKAQPGGPRKAARAKNLEHPKREAPIKPINLKTYYDTEAGRKKAAAMGIPELVQSSTDEQLDAELARVESELAELTRPVSEIPHTATPAEVQEFFEDTALIDQNDKPLPYVLTETAERIWLEQLTEAEAKEEALAAEKEKQQLAVCVLQAARELGDYPAAGLEIGLLVASKQAQYGDMISAMGPLLRILYPDGIGHNQYDDLALIVRILDKIGRITKGNGDGGESPYRDIAGYGLLGAERQQKKAG